MTRQVVKEFWVMCLFNKEMGVTKERNQRGRVISDIPSGQTTTGHTFSYAYLL